MDKLYCLTFFTSPNGNDRAGFHIGLFQTYDEAKRVAAHYQNEVPGFKDYPCDAEITQIPVIGDVADGMSVYRYVGWNEDEDDNESDILESDCYADPAQAENAYRKAQTEFPRAEWALNRHIIGKCDWQEGFARILSR